MRLLLLRLVAAIQGICHIPDEGGQIKRSRTVLTGILQPIAQLPLTVPKCVGQLRTFLFAGYHGSRLLPLLRGVYIAAVPATLMYIYIYLHIYICRWQQYLLPLNRVLIVFSTETC